MEEKTESIELNLEEMSKKDLINLILFAHKHDYTFNQAIVKALEGILAQEENNVDTIHSI
jgi:peptide subunit release factor 1 (eRF1)